MVEVAHRRFFGRHEFHFADDGAQGDFQFFHGESHADAVARTQSERSISVWVDLVLVLRRPPIEIPRSSQLLKKILNCKHKIRVADRSGSNF